jgi:hypothetical protein
MKTICKKILLILLICFSGTSRFIESYAQQVKYGIRTGINNNHKNNLDLSVYEIYLNNVPLIYSISGNIFDPLDISFEMALGLVREKTNSSLLFSMGPTLKLIDYKSIVSISTGIKPSLITNHVFNDFDLGGIFNIKSYIDFTIALTKEFELGYRFEHISNAGLYEKNPGVNFHFVEVIYVQ